MHYSNIVELVVIILLQLISIIVGSAALVPCDNDIDNGDNGGLFTASCLVQEIRIPELLRLKKSIDKMSMQSSEPVKCERNVTNSKEFVKSEDQDFTKSTIGEEATLPAALALVSTGNRNYDTVATGLADDQHHPATWWQNEEKPSKLQTLFQISITSLAFLSFGGYLLCLIVQAIKSKGTTYFHPVATTTTTNVNNSVKRIKIYRRT